MRRSIPVALALACALLVGGCFRHTFVAGAGAPDGKVVYQHWHHHWLFGLIGEQDVRLADLCPTGDATIKEEMTFANGVVNVLIGVIYSPRTVTVRCADGKQAEIELDVDQLSRIGRDPRFLEWVEAELPERAQDLRLALAASAVDRDQLAGASREPELQAARPSGR